LHALEGKKSMFRNVNIAWDFCQDDGCVADFSDDEILEMQELPAIRFIIFRLFIIVDLP
jgi:hypothetical protein